MASARALTSNVRARPMLSRPPSTSAGSPNPSLTIRAWISERGCPGRTYYLPNHGASSRMGLLAQLMGVAMGRNRGGRGTEPGLVLPGRPRGSRVSSFIANSLLREDRGNRSTGRTSMVGSSPAAAIPCSRPGIRSTSVRAKFSGGQPYGAGSARTATLTRKRPVSGTI
jgi:hypothetical protein